MGLAPNHVGGVVAGIAALCKTHLLPQQSQGRVVDPCERYLAALDQPFQMTVEQILERHFEILPGESGLPGISHSPDKVGEHEALKAPLFLEDIVEQRLVLPTPFAVDAIVGAHH